MSEATSIRVLVFPAGEINSVELHSALSKQVNVTLFGASSVDRHGPYLFSRYRSGIPFIGDPEFFDAFNALLLEWKIDVVIPTHDTIVEYFAEHRGRIQARLLVPAERTAAVCRDKRATYALFADCDFAPRVYASPGDVQSLPVFAKPVRGQGAVGARKIAKDEELRAVDWSADIVAEYLPGRELTVDCLTDASGRLIGVFPRTRDRVLGGVSIAGTAEQADSEVRAIAEAINQRLEFIGAWFFQLKADQQGRFRLLEVSARCSGSQGLTRARGVNLPLLSVYILLGRDVRVIENPYRVRMDRTLLSRFSIDYAFDTVYVDYDDTITCPQGIDPDVMRVLYQFRNQGMKIVLITRHGAEIRESLARNHIAESIFDEIVHLRLNEPKASRIDPKNAIFIDNAFAERMAVHDAYGIPVFDVDTIEVLQSWIR